MAASIKKRMNVVSSKLDDKELRALFAAILVDLAAVRTTVNAVVVDVAGVRNRVNLGLNLLDADANVDQTNYFATANVAAPTGVAAAALTLTA